MNIEKLLAACEQAILCGYQEVPSQEAREYAEYVLAQIDKAKTTKVYTSEEIKGYLLHWAKPSLSTDALAGGELENMMLLGALWYFDKSSDSNSMDGFLKRDIAKQYIERASRF